MPFTLIVEDGTGKPDANSYASVADGDAYHQAHLYPEAWTGATADRKAIALAMATRVINAALEWRGNRGSGEQALEWPRYRVPRPDTGRVVLGNIGNYWPEGNIPQILKNATCEQARALLEDDRTADPGSKGVKRFSVGQGAVDVEFDRHDRPGPLSDEVLRLLEPLGSVRGNTNVVRLTRVQ